MEVETPRRDCGCRSRLDALTRLRSAVAYEGPIEAVVRRFKYEGWRKLAIPLARLVAERLAVEGVAAQWIVAVPLHAQRVRQRGFNQAELLARELREKMLLSSPHGELVRTRPTPPQVGQDRLRRFANVEAAFTWQGASLNGKSILLIDDVATTGATLNACATALRKAGSGPVTGVSVARVTV